MATQVQRRRGTTAQHAAFSGQLAELTVDTDKMTVVVQDGSTLGGFPLAKESDLTADNITITDTAGNFTATDVEGALAELAASSGGALTYFEESRNNTSPNVTVPVHRFIPTGTETDIDILLAPKGYGSILADTPNGLASGGNKRGGGAIDLQMRRFAATSVASGDESVLIGGLDNAVTNQFAVIIGGHFNANAGYASSIGGGDSNIVGLSNYSGIAGGQNNETTDGGAVAIGGGGYNIANGNYSTVVGGDSNEVHGAWSTSLGGRDGSAFDLRGKVIYSSGGFSRLLGSAQYGLQVLSRITTDATPGVLTVQGGSADTLNLPVLRDTSAYTFTGSVVARSSGEDVAAWKVEGAVKRGSGVATTAIVGTPVKTVIAKDAGASAWDLAVTADTTNGAPIITVTGAAATTIRWVCTFETTELRGV